MTQFSSVDYRLASGQVTGYVDRIGGGDAGNDVPIAPPRPPPSRNVVRADPPSFGDTDDRMRRRQEQRKERERIRMEQDLPLEKRPIMRGEWIVGDEFYVRLGWDGKGDGKRVGRKTNCHNFAPRYNLYCNLKFLA